MQHLSQLIAQHPNLTAEGIRRNLPSSVPRVSDRTIRKYRRELLYTLRHQRLTSRQSGSYDQPAVAVGVGAPSISCLPVAAQ